MKCTGKKISLVFLHRNKFVHWVSLPGIPVPVSEFPVHVPVPNKYARIPVPANYPGTGSAQPLGVPDLFVDLKQHQLLFQIQSKLSTAWVQLTQPLLTVRAAKGK